MKAYRIEDHTAWDELTKRKDDKYYCIDVNNDKSYINEDHEWRSQYDSIISVPIQFKNPRTDDPPILFGFLSITCQNEKKHPIFDDYDLYHIAKNAADILSMFWLILEFVTSPLGKKLDEK